MVYKEIIMELDNYEKKILETWEEVYKKGLLTFWILLSLRASDQYMGSIKDFIKKFTNNSVVADDKSMYRAIRRLCEMELMQPIENISSISGPAKKLYSLTQTGQNILQAFIRRNITGIFFQPEIKKLL